MKNYLLSIVLLSALIGFVAFVESASQESIICPYPEPPALQHLFGLVQNFITLNNAHITQQIQALNALTLGQVVTKCQLQVLESLRSLNLQIATLLTACFANGKAVDLATFTVDDNNQLLTICPLVDFVIDANIVALLLGVFRNCMETVQADINAKVDELLFQFRTCPVGLCITCKIIMCPLCIC